jgi:hypothetical protein
MGDSDGVFGGNGSVYFRTRIRNPKPPGRPTVLPFGEMGYLVEGHDGTPARTNFKITINVTDKKKRLAVAKSMRKAVLAILKTGKGEFALRVEKGQHEQITVAWGSAEEHFEPAPVTRGPTSA